MFKAIILGQLRHLLLSGPVFTWVLEQGISKADAEHIALGLIAIFVHVWSAVDKYSREKVNQPTGGNP